MLSSGNVKYKRSSLERITNWFVAFCVVLLVFMVVSGGICSIIWLREYQAHTREIPFVVLLKNSAVKDGLLNMATYILVYQVCIRPNDAIRLSNGRRLQTLIPLSLYISIEMVKLGQVRRRSRPQTTSRTLSDLLDEQRHRALRSGRRQASFVPLANDQRGARPDQVYTLR